MEMFMGKLVKMAMAEVSNFANLEDKATFLGEKLDLLKGINTDVRKELEKKESDIRGKKRKREVKGWLKSVVKKRRECEKLIEDVKNCRFFSRGELTTQVVHMVQEVTELIEQSRCFQGLVRDNSETKKVPLVTSRALGDAFEHNLERIWASVMDDTISSIGIHGMGGVGKTTLALQVHDNLLRKSKFGDRVYWITVSQDFSICRLQKDIAKTTGIDLSDEEDEKKRAGILQFHLKKKLNFALILDDVWKGFDVEEIGIPLKGLKLLVTSREGQVCREMRCNDLIKVEVLSEIEAWELFQEKLKSSPISHLELGPEATQIAQEVAKECAGLPLGIITIAASMRSVTDIHEWRNALEELKESFTEHEYMKDKVLPILLYSYNRLRNPILQSCFLYCSLYPEDKGIQKHELIRSFVYEEIMDKRSSRRSDFDQAYAMLSKLESACLLEACSGNYSGAYGVECVKMHDLIRDMALWITRENPRFMVKSGMQLEEVPPEDEWAHDFNRVSLMDNKIKIIPDGISPRCPSLSSLYLNRNDFLTSISGSFFMHMKSLHTLDLSDTGIVALPDSVSNLVTLKAMLLRNCMKLVSLPSLEHLKALTELDLCNTSVEVIHGLESLTNLKRLEFQHVKDKDTPPLVFHGLTRLQGLILSERKLVEIEEVKSLRHLEEFQGRFAKMNEFRQFMISMNSRRQLRFCCIFVGEDQSEYIDDYYSISGESLDIGVRIIGKKTGEIAICDEMMLPLQDIEYLTISKAEDMECLLRVSRQDEEMKNLSSLEHLNFLSLSYLPKLKNIIEWEGSADTVTPPPLAATFSSLTHLEVESCHGMKKLLPLCLVDNLRNLEVLRVCDCSGMEEIIFREDNEGEENNMGYTANTITLPKLKILSLLDLPELKSICKSIIICNYIWNICIHGCTKLKKIPLSFQNPSTQLDILETESEWCDSLEWDHPHHKNILQPFLEFSKMEMFKGKPVEMAKMLKGKPVEIAMAEFSEMEMFKGKPVEMAKMLKGKPVEIAMAEFSEMEGKLVEMAMAAVSNFANLEDKATYLQGKLDLLKGREADVLAELQVEESLTRGKKRKREVEEWLKSVVKKRRECEKLIEDVPNCRLFSRGELATQVVHMVQEVTELIEQSRYFQGLVLDTLEPEKLPLVTSRPHGHAFKHNLRKIMACVTNHNKTTIGIHGMGGVGKTTLALQVHDNLLRESKFGGCVYWITVSQDFSIYRLQKDIAEAAGIDLSDEEDEKKRAVKIRFHLKEKLNFALILDDVSKGFDAEEIGVPLEGRKLLVTSREGQVCCEMDCNDVIKVEVLSEIEAWKLFQEKLKLFPTSHLELGPEATHIAQEVTKECAGLPLCIITIAASMRGVTDVHDWRNALEELKESFTKHEYMKDKVLPILLYSYNRLRNPILQSCFLYFSLYPEDEQIPKRELVRSFVYEEIKYKRNSRRSDFDQGYSILSKLENACLLAGCEDRRGVECVKMHDLIRDMALWITREKTPRFMVKSGMQLEEVPPEDEWAHDLNRVSLMHNRISIIPNGISPRCPSLSSLYLNSNPLTSVADSFFVHMKSLHTLDLSGTDIVALSDSISLLGTLKALLLRNCIKLVSLPSLENLKALIELDLSNTSIVEVIHGLESLTNLKCLEFKHVARKDTSPLSLHGLISMQRLILCENKLVEFEEVKSLRHLEEFQGGFASTNEFRQFIISMNSRRQLRFCHVFVGKKFESKDSEIDKSDILVWISGVKTGEIAIDDEMMLPLRDIGYLRIEDSEDMKCLLRVSHQDEEVKDWSPLERLKYLHLITLPELKNIIEWEGSTDTIIPPPQAATFSSLIQLKVHKCNGMKKLLPLCLVDNLRNLEVLYVGFCSGMEEIIFGEDNEREENNMGNTANTITLPKLKSLDLRYLPELKSICKSTIICNSIQNIYILGCTKLKKIPLSFPHLNSQQPSSSTFQKHTYLHTYFGKRMVGFTRMRPSSPQKHSSTLFDFIRTEPGGA